VTCRLLIFAALACIPQLTNADTIQDGRNACRHIDNLNSASDAELVGIGKCLGMADGVVQVMVYNCILAADAPVPKASAPPSIGAAIQAFLNWADAHPERWGDSFSAGMMAAAMDTFPCEN